MSWQKEVQAVLESYYRDPNAVVVCIAMFQRFKTIELAAVNAEETAQEVVALLVNDHLILQSNPFWLMHGAVISLECGSRFFEWLKANKMLQANSKNPVKLSSNLQAFQMRKSFLSVADLILRLHVPFSEYTRNMDRLYEDLAAIEIL